MQTVRLQHSSAHTTVYRQTVYQHLPHRRLRSWSKIRNWNVYKSAWANSRIRYQNHFHKKNSHDKSHFFFCQVKRRRQYSPPAGSSSWPPTSQFSSSWPATPPFWCHSSRPGCTSCHSTVLKNSSKQAHITWQLNLTVRTPHTSRYSSNFLLFLVAVVTTITTATTNIIIIIFITINGVKL